MNANMEKLKNRDYVILLDKSGSMVQDDTPSGKPRWKAMQETTLEILKKVSEYDPDGVTVYTFDDSFKKYENVTPANLETIFKQNSPGNGTAFVPVLTDVFNAYTARKKADQTKPNGEILLVITDGAPQDAPATMKKIVEFGNSLASADDEYGISFFQIGKDQGASQFLQQLDDELVSKHGAKNDIVDTKTFEQIGEIGLTEALTEALVG